LSVPKSLLPKGSVDQVVGWANWTGSRFGLVLLAFAALYPVLTGDQSLLLQYIPIGIYAIVTVGLNFCLGSAGEFALGQAGVFAAGAYTAGILTSEYHWSFWVALPFAVVVAAGVGLLAGAPGLRVGGWYFALTTLFVAAVIPEIAEVSPHTGGQQGIGTIPFPSVAGVTLSYTQLYLFILFSLVVLMLLLANFMRSRWGLAFVSMRQSNRAAESTGIAVLRMKLLAYTIAGVFAGYAGAILPHIDGYLSPDAFPFSLSILFIAAVTIGGIGSFAGPVVGVALLQILPNAVSGFTKYSLLIYGSLLIIGMIFIRDGLVPTARHLWVRLVVATSRRRGWVADDHPPPRTDVEVDDAVDAAIAEELESFRAAGRAAAGGPLDGVLEGTRRDPLVVDGVSKRFGGVQALEGVSLAAEPGQLTAVIGPNGSGKTTLLNMVLGFYSVDAGRITLGDRVLSGRRPFQVSRAGVARTFQTPVIIPGRSCCENVMSGMFRQRRVTVAEILVRAPRARRDWLAARTKALDLLDAVGLGPEAEREASSLTAGQQRLLEIARALATDPVAILLDEPAAGLVGHEVTALATLLAALRDQGYIVVLVEHNVNLVMSIADHVVVLDQGRVVADADPASVQADPRVLACYLGEVANA